MAPIETITGEHWQIRVGDVMDGLASLADSSVHCCVTSPPYWGLRDYGFIGQIGSEKTPDEFVEKLVGVFEEVRRVLRDDGVLFVNLGDTFSACGSGGAGKELEYQGEQVLSRKARRLELTAGNKIGVPWRFALAMQNAGWILRQDVIWSKPAPMPESIAGSRWIRCRQQLSKGAIARHGIERGVGHVNESNVSAREDGAKWTECPGCDKCESTNGLILRRGSWRPTTSHEYIFQFVKSQSYFCDGDGSKEAATGMPSGNKSKKWGNNDTTVRANGTGVIERQSNIPHGGSETRNQRSVWRVTAEGFKGAHFATFPTELPRRCLIAATSRGGCCSACGAQYAPVVESKRVATRPGTHSKVNRASDDAESLYHQHSGDVVGNRDPQRHTTTTVVTGYLPTCKCSAPASRPTVLDPFGGSMTTGQVAINMGCEFIGLEGNPEYAKLGMARLETPWVPVSERKKATKPRRQKVKNQKQLF